MTVSRVDGFSSLGGGGGGGGGVVPPAAEYRSRMQTKGPLYSEPRASKKVSLVSQGKVKIFSEIIYFHTAWNGTEGCTCVPSRFIHLRFAGPSSETKRRVT